MYAIYGDIRISSLFLCCSCISCFCRVAVGGFVQILDLPHDIMYMYLFGSTTRVVPRFNILMVFIVACSFRNANGLGQVTVAVNP